MINQKSRFEFYLLVQYRGSICHLGILLILIVMQFYVYSNLLAKEFELAPTRINFLGAVGSGKNIIVYGDYGSYLLSSDLGNSWTQHSIGIFDEIREIVNFKDTLWGITHKGYLILSIDNGINWNLHKLEIDTAERLVSLIVKDNAIFVRGLKFVMRISKNLQVEGIFQDTSLELKTWELFTEPEMPPLHYYTTKGMHYWNDKLILYSKNFADSGFLVIKDNFTDLEYIILKGKIRGWPATE